MSRSRAPTTVQRRYGLSIAAQECLLRPDSLASVGPLFDLLPAVNRVYPAALVDAYRTGAGIAYADYALHDAQGDFNRPAYVNLLASDWLAAVPGLTDRLEAPGATCRRDRLRRGLGRDLVGEGLPRAHGRRLRQRRRVHRRGPQARRRRRRRRPSPLRGHRCHGDLPAGVEAGAYDLVMAFEMIHDLARPVEALATMRRLGKPDAVHMVMDEKVADTFEAPTENPIERLMYASSVLHCLPVGRADTPSEATGTVMRPATFAGLRPASRLRRRRGAPDRARPLPLLPAASVTQ